MWIFNDCSFIYNFQTTPRRVTLTDDIASIITVNKENLTSPEIANINVGWVKHYHEGGEVKYCNGMAVF